MLHLIRSVYNMANLIVVDHFENFVAYELSDYITVWVDWGSEYPREVIIVQQSTTDYANFLEDFEQGVHLVHADMEKLKNMWNTGKIWDYIEDAQKNNLQTELNFNDFNMIFTPCRSITLGQNSKTMDCTMSFFEFVGLLELLWICD